LRAELAEERKFNRELLGKIGSGDSEGRKRRSLKDDLKDMIEIQGMLGNFGNKSTDWKDVALEIGAKTLDTLQSAFQAYTVGRGARPQPRPQPAGADTAALPSVAHDTETGAAEALTEEERMRAFMQMAQQFGPMLDEIFPLMAESFDNDNGMIFR